jgi:cytochrome c biogenesis protein CcdA
MYEVILLLLSALWFGILTSISPCPLATNIAAISFLSKKLGSKKEIFISGILYILGRSLIYIMLTVIIVLSIISIPELSYFLQNYINKILGLVLILAGMFLLEVLTINTKSNWISDYAQRLSGKYGLISSLLIGALFALAFCPVSAALFFGGLIPIAIKSNLSWFMALIYGLGTALPVFLFSFLISFGVKSIDKYFNKITIFELWARRITGIIFVLIGVYYSLTYIFKVL